MVVMLSLREWFSKRVRNIPVSINLLNDHILALQNLTDQVKFSEYVLGAMMCPRFFGLCYRASIVAIHNHGFRDTRDYTKFVLGNSPGTEPRAAEVRVRSGSLNPRSRFDSESTMHRRIDDYRCEIDHTRRVDRLRPSLLLSRW